MMKPKSNISLFKPEESSQKSIELNPFEMPIKASGYGSFSSPSLDFPEDKINLQELLIKDEECTFYGRISGDSLAGLGIFDKGIVGIQKGLTLNPNDIVIAYIDGMFYAKIFKPLYSEKGVLESLKLKSENQKEIHKDYIIDEKTEFILWGKVIWSINFH